jgi:hypothetical protein
MLLQKDSHSHVPYKLFLLYHSYQDANDDTQSKDLCFHYDREFLRETIKHYLSLPGFREHPDGFEIIAVTFGLMHWEEGFVSEPYNKTGEIFDKEAK